MDTKQLKPLPSEALTRLLPPHYLIQALQNWKLIQEAIGLTTPENEGAIISTVLIETARTFQPIREYGTRAYFIRNYWDKKSTRDSLGNIEADDAWRYCGRGFIQLSGRDNYLKVGRALGLDLLNHPELLLQAEPSAKALAWYWKTHSLKLMADSVPLQHSQASRDKMWARIRKEVNGGYNGLADYLHYLDVMHIR